MVIFISGLRIAREYQRAVVFRLGRYTGQRGPGIFWLIPLGVENETRIDLRVVTNPIEQQETITRDSVTVKVNAVLWFRVSDPQKAVLTVENFRSAVQQVALTSLRNVIGQHDLDEVLKERDKINALLKRNVFENTAAWGVTVELLEMKDVEIPQDMQRRDGDGGRGHARETRPHHQGRGRTGGIEEACGRRAVDGREPRPRTGVARACRWSPRWARRTTAPP